MKFPKLVPKNICKTDIHVTLYSEEISEEGSPIIVLDNNYKCNYQDTAKKILTDNQMIIEISGSAFFSEDIAPDLSVISSGKVIIFGKERQIIKGTKARNFDGTVNYIRLDLQ